MRRAVFPLAATAVLVAVAVLCLLSPPALATPAAASSSSPAVPDSAQAGLVLSKEVPLVTVGQAVRVKLSWNDPGSWPATVANVLVRGPGDPADYGEDWPVRSTLTLPLGGLSPSFEKIISLPGEAFAGAGGYWVEATLTSGAQEIRAGMWLGAVDSSLDSVDLAFVWPLALGIHRDGSGVFVDDVIQRAAVGGAGQSQDLRAFLATVAQFPEWHVTLAIEPVLLAQLRDIANGFRQLDASGNVDEVAQSDPACAGVEHLLAQARLVASLEHVEVLATPYTMPALPALGALGWRDGLDQIQLGKAETAVTLGLPDPPSGGFPPALDLTTASLGYFADAAVEYAVVSGELTRDLEEVPTDPDLPVRTRDWKNDRLTLVFADEGLREVVGEPWDANLFFAGMASRLARGQTQLLVVASRDDYGIPPAAYLERLWRTLDSLPWVRTLTLAEAVDAYPPSSRPVFLSRYGGSTKGYVANSLAGETRAAHAQIDDLRAAVGAGDPALEDALLKLFSAESRYWTAAGVRPELANRCLVFLQEAKRIALAGLQRVSLDVDSEMGLLGRDGSLVLKTRNDAPGTLTLAAVLTGEGVTFPDGGRLELAVGPGSNEFSVPMDVGRGSGRVAVRLTAGATVVAEETTEVHRVSTLLLVLVAGPGILALGGFVYLVLWLVARARKRRGLAAQAPA